MIDRLMTLTGMAHASTSEMLAILLLLGVCSLALGWMTDGVMGDLGFVVIGNGLLTALSGVGGMFAFSWAGTSYLGRYLAWTDLMVVVVAASIFSVTALLALAMAKKYVSD